MAYQPIENYGIIGDLHSVALVGMDGSTDWLSLRTSTPRAFLAPSSTTRTARGDVRPHRGRA